MLPYKKVLCLTSTVVKVLTGVHIYYNHSYKMDVFHVGIFLDALASLKTMLSMNKNQSVANREAGMARGWRSA